MLKLDSDNLEAIKDLNEVTVDEASERNESFTNSDISHLPKENEFLARWMKRWESLKQFERNSQCKGGITNSAVRQKVGKLCNDFCDGLDAVEGLSIGKGIARMREN